MKDRGLSRKMLPRAHKATLRSLTSTYLRAVAGPARMQIADAGDARTPTRATAPTGRADAAASGGLPEGRRPVGPTRATVRFPMPNGRTGRRVRRAGCRQSPRLNRHFPYERPSSGRLDHFGPSVNGSGAPGDCLLARGRWFLTSAGVSATRGAPTGHSSPASARPILSGSPVMPARAAPATGQSA